MELNGFMIGPEIKMLFKIKVVTVTARHPVSFKACLPDYCMRGRAGGLAVSSAYLV